MNSNKGFAVSTVLYALLIVFLMFTLVLIASYNASSDVLSSATSDLTENNSFTFTVKQVKPSDKLCGENGWDWYNTNTILQVKAQQGTFYWPKDWYNYDNENGLIGKPINNEFTYNGLKAECLLNNGEYGSCEGLSLKSVNNFMTYDGSETKRFKRDELKYIYNLLSKINTSFGPNNDYPDVIYDQNLRVYYCNLNTSFNIRCYNDSEHSYSYKEFKEKYNPKYRCFLKSNVKYCGSNSVFKTCKDYGKAIECTAKMTISDSVDTNFSYGINEYGKELKGNRFIYVSDESTGVNFNQKDKFNFFVNPVDSSGYTYIYDKENHENYFNVNKLKDTLDYGGFFVRFSNKLNNKTQREIILSNFCID